MALQPPPFGRSIYLLCTSIHFQTHLSYFILYPLFPLITNILIAQEVSNVAKEIGCNTTQVALNWIRQQNMLLTQKNKIIPIIGSRKESEIKDNLACLEFVLSNDQMQRLNEISKIELGFPHDFLNSEMIKEIIYGGTYSSMVLKK